MSDIDVDRNAPVFAEAVTELPVPAQAVWAALTDVASWPEFIPDVTAARLDGVLAPGSVLHWSVRGMEITSPLATVEPPRRLVWRGTETAVHVWEITPTATGCSLRNAESLGRPFPGRTAEETRELISGFLAIWNNVLGERARELPRS